MSQRMGKATIRIGSQVLDSMPGATLKLGGVNRAPVVGANKVLGFSEEPTPGMLDCTVSLAAGQSVKDLDFTDSTVTFSADTGQVWSGANAWLASPPELTANSGGNVKLSIACADFEEIT